ncbi:MAG: hypothetical protein ACYTF0_04240 [Planctomycetota bacterium]|jgi:hypothetical protein
MSTDIHLTLDSAYGTHPRQCCQLAIPADAGERATVITIGDDWSTDEASTAEMALLIDLARHGHAAAHIDGRSSKQAGSATGAVNEAVRAVAHAVAEAACAGAALDRCLLLGRGRGAILALRLAQALAVEAEAPRAVGIVLVDGVLDPTSVDNAVDDSFATSSYEADSWPDHLLIGTADPAWGDRLRAAEVAVEHSADANSIGAAVAAWRG